MLSSNQGDIMVEVKVSKVCGLCAGCKRSIDTALSVSKNNKTVLYKEIVHNKNVNNMLQNLGIKTVEDLSNVDQDECVILRAHGEAPQTYEFLKNNNIRFTDCTCPNVIKIHDLVHEYSLKGYKIILIGKYGKHSGKVHPEVSGTIGWCKNDAILIEDDEDVNGFTPSKNNKFYLVCQTTFNEIKAEKIIDAISNRCNSSGCELIINNSICFAQKSINIASVDLAKTCDIMIVVGGKNSSNSIELFNNIKKHTNTIFIEDIHDWKTELQTQNIPYNNTTRFGLTAGASTLKDELIELKNLIENEFQKKV